MEQIINKRWELQAKIDDAKEQIDKINRDENLSDAGKQSKAQPYRDKIDNCHRLIKSLFEQTREAVIDSLDGTPAVDPADLMNRAGVLGHALSGMSNEEILNIYQARFGDPTDRVLLESHLQLRIDAAKERPDQADSFSRNYEQTRESLKREQPDYQKRTVDIDYIDAALTVNDIESQEFNGGAVDGDLNIMRVNANHKVDQYEQQTLKGDGDNE